MPSGRARRNPPKNESPPASATSAPTVLVRRSSGDTPAQERADREAEHPGQHERSDHSRSSRRPDEGQPGRQQAQERAERPRISPKMIGRLWAVLCPRGWAGSSRRRTTRGSARGPPGRSDPAPIRRDAAPAIARTTAPRPRMASTRRADQCSTPVAPPDCRSQPDHCQQASAQRTWPPRAAIATARIPSTAAEGDAALHRSRRERHGPDLQGTRLPMLP